jgi:hypothetical protein
VTNLGVPLIVTGVAGCGKSALLANFALQREQLAQQGASGTPLIIYHFVGASEKTYVL